MSMQLMVRAMTVEADGVLSVELVSPDSDPLPAWEPGAHVDLQLGEGLVRQYSLCGSPSDRSRYRLGVLHEPKGRGGSAHVHEVLRPGHTVTVHGPRNHFRLEDADRYVFVAGGIG
jgi:tetrachlorobenzoquinone reductase